MGPVRAISSWEKLAELTIRGRLYRACVTRQWKGKLTRRGSQRFLTDTLERGQYSPKVPACAIEQQASEVRMLLAYRNICLLKKASVFERQATYVPKKSSLPWTSLFITLVKYQDISRFPYQIFKYLDIFGCQDILMSTYTSPAAL